MRRITGAPVAARENGDAPPGLPQYAGDFNHRRRFACAARRDVADADDRARQRRLFQPAAPIRHDAQPDKPCVSGGKRGQQREERNLSAEREQRGGGFLRWNGRLAMMYHIKYRIFYIHTIIKLDNAIIKYYILDNKDR